MNKEILMKLVITATSLGIIKHIAIRNRGMKKKCLMEPIINATGLDMSKKIAARNKDMNKQISHRTKK